MVCFFDDFVALVQRGLVDRDLAVFSRFSQLVGVGLKPGQSSAGSQITFVGLLRYFPM